MSNQDQGTGCAPCTEMVNDSGLPGECPPKPCTLCDGDTKNNVWVERAPGEANANRIGICLLNTMTEAQVIYVLERDEVARRDLFRVTTNPYLLNLARETPRLPTTEESDTTQTRLNRHNSPASIPFYGIFRGQPPFTQGSR